MAVKDTIKKITMTFTEVKDYVNERVGSAIRELKLEREIQIKSAVSVLEEKVEKNLKENYLTLKEYEPVRKVVFGVVTLILVAFVGALIGFAFTGRK